MKIDLIGMIFNVAGSRHFDQLIIDDNGNRLDALHSLDILIMEYAKVRNGEASSIAAVPKALMEAGSLARQESAAHHKKEESNA